MSKRYQHHQVTPARRLAKAGTVAAAATVVTVALAACGGGSSPGASGTAASGTSSASGASSAAPTGIVAQTLTLQFNEPVSLNPALGGTSESDVAFGALDYDSLIYQEGNGTFVPDLATSWGYAAGSANKVFNLTLRSGVHFSDGSLLTPASVVNSLEYFKKAGGPQASYLAALTSAKASGANTVQLTFAAPEPDLPFLLSQYQNIGQIIGPKGIASPASLTTSSDGAGAYVLDGAQSVTNSSYAFTLNKHYWNPSAVHYRTVNIKVITDPETAISAAQTSQVDALLSMPATSSKTATADGLKTFNEPFSIASLILMGRSDASSPLSNLKVRQAINDAVDRKDLATGLGGGAAIATDEFAIPGATGYDPALADTYAYDTAKANTLALDANGNIGASLKTELAAIGINVELTETPSPAQFIPAALSKQYDAVIWPLSQNGGGFYYAVQFAMAPFTNVFGSTSTTLNQLMATAGGDSSTTAAAADYQKVNDYLVSNAWFVPLFSLSATMVVGSGVANIQTPSAANTTIDPVAPDAALSWYPAS
jgi:peptide/nickel transport system substrate-binding protein